jgi:hypothetical protein
VNTTRGRFFRPLPPLPNSPKSGADQLPSDRGLVASPRRRRSRIHLMTQFDLANRVTGSLLPILRIVIFCSHQLPIFSTLAPIMGIMIFYSRQLSISASLVPIMGLVMSGKKRLIAFYSRQQSISSSLTPIMGTVIFLFTQTLDHFFPAANCGSRDLLFTPYTTPTLAPWRQ